MGEKINEGLRILAERVKTNPDEFLAKNDKWWEAKKYLESNEFPWTAEEKKLIEDINVQIKQYWEHTTREKFTSLVMETLMGEVDPISTAIYEEPKPLVKRNRVTKHELDALKYTDPNKHAQLKRLLADYLREHQQDE